MHRTFVSSYGKQSLHGPTGPECDLVWAGLKAQLVTRKVERWNRRTGWWHRPEPKGSGGGTARLGGGTAQHPRGRAVAPPPRGGATLTASSKGRAVVPPDWAVASPSTREVGRWHRHQEVVAPPINGQCDIVSSGNPREFKIWSPNLNPLGQLRAGHRSRAAQLHIRSVIKETLRLHPSAPLIPRICTKTCDVPGHEIQVGTRVFVNVWAMGRDPQYWDDAESFKPERFQGSAMDFRGVDFEYVLFGAGRRMCPWIGLGMATV
ncbi:hypothetical protein C4D60_Mb02t02810 [Musa balbisiana]|uniref:Cytochrome P450 n=1 Tax=Musa balbisiana TaxID=52838 RepID=A0A4S8I7V5_MUSBA|nr:hypothetical protein C4D60_Mb02t02810 [Musa balbisiana]